ncbi:MAG: DUF2442 domain-containing protein [Kiritimatiellaeota bacterium]|nr:DUF2442 domain-containing protein [Kiritimatiellota bacterium]
MNTGADELLWVTKAEYVGGYTLLLTFSNHVVKCVDLKDCLYGEVFEPLRDVEKFKRFTLSDWTMEWSNGADFAPEYLLALDDCDATRSEETVLI